MLAELEYVSVARHQARRWTGCTARWRRCKVRRERGLFDVLTPLQIEFQNTQPIEPVEFRIRRELAEFEKFYHRLVSCRVEVELPKHQRRGSVSKIRIDFGVPAEGAATTPTVRGAPAKADTGTCRSRRNTKIRSWRFTQPSISRAAVWRISRGVSKGASGESRPSASGGAAGC
jgi:hypothetical protein